MMMMMMMMMMNDDYYYYYSLLTCKHYANAHSPFNVIINFYNHVVVYEYVAC